MRSDPVLAPRLALLIDAQRVASPEAVAAVLAVLGERGRVTVRRAYGDWTAPALAGWTASLRAGAIQPVQAFGATATGALIVEAMDLLHADAVDGFCLMPGGDAVLRLAQRIREAGLTVIGVADDDFAPACDELLGLAAGAVAASESDAPATDARSAAGADACSAPRPAAARVGTTEPRADIPPTPRAPKLRPPPFPSAPQTAAELAADARLLPGLRDAMTDCAVEDGWAWLGAVSQRLRKLRPDFDPRQHGYAKLTELVEATGCFELERRGGGWHARARELLAEASLELPPAMPGAMPRD